MCKAETSGLDCASVRSSQGRNLTPEYPGSSLSVYLCASAVLPPIHALIRSGLHASHGFPMQVTHIPTLHPLGNCPVEIGLQG